MVKGNRNVVHRMFSEKRQRKLTWGKESPSYFSCLHMVDVCDMCKNL